MKYNFYKSRIKNYQSFSNNGFTLIEILVALGIFSVVISITVGIFVSGSSSQRKILEFYDIQREGNYLMETVSRELRMASTISDGTDGNEDQQNNNNSSVEFTNYDNNLTRYCRSDAAGVCTENDSGDYFSRDGKIIISNKVIITDLKFYISQTFTQVQPVVTVVMKVKSTGSYGTEILLQNSIALRRY